MLRFLSWLFGRQNKPVRQSWETAPKTEEFLAFARANAAEIGSGRHQALPSGAKNPYYELLRLYFEQTHKSPFADDQDCYEIKDFMVRNGWAN